MNGLPAELKGRKASEVFLDYCRPLLEGFAAEGTTSLDLVKNGLRIPWMIWNACVLDEYGNSKMAYIGSIKMHLRSSSFDAGEFIKFWENRKKEFFSEYTYSMSDYELKGKDIFDFVLRMEARSVGSQQSRDQRLS